MKLQWKNLMLRCRGSRFGNGYAGVRLGCSKKSEKMATETPQKIFATPAEASQALHAAVQAKDDKSADEVSGLKAKKYSVPGPAEESL